MRFKHILGLLCAASMSVALAGAASAQNKTVKIGAIYPLSGNAASAGVHAKAAIETAVEIINNGHPGLGNLPVDRRMPVCRASAAPRSRWCSPTTRAAPRPDRTRRCA